MRHHQNQSIFKTSFGWAGVAVSAGGICGIVLPRKTKREVERELESSEPSGTAVAPDLKKAVKFLQQYFSGKRVSFDIPLDTRYYTPFQQTVWKAAGEIPFGETRSYAWIAKKIKNPRAVRAVGQALGANPIPIIIPCHRVISSAGTLGGYAGGLSMKKRLLKLEQKKLKKNVKER